MLKQNMYIFKEGELFLLEGNSLPDEIPAEFASCVTDSLDLVLAGKSARVVLVADEKSRQTVVSASVCDPRAPASGATGFCSAQESRGHWMRLRSLIASEDPVLARLAAPATRAAGLINWHSANRFCGRCGGHLSNHPVELALKCESCGSISFPRLSPAIIVLVKKEGKILLARHAARNTDVFACLAGFLEHGETLEECVAREVFEETHLRVRNIQYAGSQSWPYPDQYMIAFYADWESGEISEDPGEILEARWFDLDNLPATPMPGTVAWRLIHGVLATSSKK